MDEGRFFFDRIDDGFYAVRSNIVTGDKEYVGQVQRFHVTGRRKLTWVAYFATSPRQTAGSAATRDAAAKLLV